MVTIEVIFDRFGPIEFASAHHIEALGRCSVFRLEQRQRYRLLVLLALAFA